MQKKTNYFTIFAIVAMAFLCFALICYPIANDTFYNIKIGNLILQNGIDMQDHFSWISNLQYTYPHWLFDIVVAIIYNLGNFKGLYILAILAYFTIGLLIYHFSKKRTQNYLFSFILTFITLISLAPFITIRAQIISFIIFLLEKYFLDKFLEFSKKKDALIIVLLSFILVNVHLATWLFFFILFLPPLVSHYVTLFLKKIKKTPHDLTIGLIEFKTNPHISKLWMLIGLCLLTGLLTPLNMTPYTYIFKQFLGGSLNFIDEYKSATLSNSFNFFLILGLYILLVLLAKKKISFEDLLLILGLIFMSLIAVRNVAYFLLIGIFPFSNYLGKVAKTLKTKTKVKLDLIFLDKKRLVILTIFFIIIGLTLSNKEYLKGNFLNEKLYPLEAVTYLKDNLTKEDKLFNEYEIGSYLLFNDVKVFVDSRSDLYTKPFNNLNRDIIKDYLRVYEYLDYEEVFKNYDITHIILPSKHPLIKILLQDSNYQDIYKDDNFVILKKLTNL